MLIRVGSTNQVKLEAVQETIADYELLTDAKVLAANVGSDVSEQPASLAETVSGAKNRARNAFAECELSVGLEGGLMQVPESKTGYMNVCACAIYDGEQFHLGLSSGFEHPPAAIAAVFDQGLDISQAYHHVGLSASDELGRNQGAIGVLTRKRVMRKEYMQQALVTALIHLENQALFACS